MAEFQLILLSEFKRPPPRDDPLPEGDFSLIPFPAMPDTKIAAKLAEFAATWLRPHEALTILDSAYKKTDTAKHLLIERLRSGAILAVAERSAWTGDRSHSTGPIGITTDQWGYWKPQIGFWEAGDMHLYLGHYKGAMYSVEVRYNGVRFDPDTVAELASMAGQPTDTKPQAVAPPVTPAPNKGGRPRKDWWDDFWIEICGQIYEGALSPKRQADLEKAMLDWATNHGHNMSEATARKVARKLFVAWKLGG